LLHRTFYIAAAVASLALSAAGRPAIARDQLTIGISQYPSTLNPLIEAMAAKSYVLGMTNRPFTTFDKDWKLVCLLCTELPTIENGGAVVEDLGDGKQGIAVTYRIQPKAAWGDGTPVTTRDVLFTWEVGRHPQSGVTGGEGFRRILRIDAPDDKTFTLHVDRVTYEYNAINDFQLLPAHLERPVFEADPAQYRVRSLFETDPTRPGLYHGPYRIAQVSAGSHITLERNAAWTGRPAAFPRITLRTIENTAALESNLLSNGVDYIPGEMGLPLDQALALEKRQGARYDVIYQPTLFYEHIDLNLDNPVLKDRRVRQALVLGLDRAALNAQLFGGKQPVADSFLNPLDWSFDAGGLKYGYDPDRAGALLAEAGWSVLKNGVRHNAAGEPLAFEINSTAGNKSRELVQQVLQSQWRKIGIDLRIRNMAPRVLFGDLTSKRRYPAMALYAWLSAPDSVPRTTLHSDQIPTEANAWTGQNYPGFNDPEVDALIDRLERELDREKRRVLWHELQRRYSEALPAVPLFFRSSVFVKPKWLGGIEPTGHQYPTTLWVENWTAP
jgi:peptide/nickel transport system substrate-binding protein